MSNDWSKLVITCPEWRVSPSEKAPLEDEIHIWRAFLDQPACCVRRLASTLSADERARAERFHFGRDRRRFVVGRGVLRGILGRCLGIEPGQVRFRYGAYGKPHLAESFTGNAPCFNVAHSSDLALYALTLGREVGVDVEHVRLMPDAAQIAQRFFSSSEYRTWQALPTDQQQEAFFNCWTRKEAYLKATGDGFSRPLDSFNVSLVPGHAARLLSVRGQPEEAGRWSLVTFTPLADCLATVAVEGHSWHAVYLEAQPD